MNEPAYVGQFLEGAASRQRRMMSIRAATINKRWSRDRTPAQSREPFNTTGAAGQRDFVARLRADACLEKSTPLGFPPNQHPRQMEAGVTVQTYFANKHARGERGRFYLHQTAGWASNKGQADDYR